MKISYERIFCNVLQTTLGENWLKETDLRTMNRFVSDFIHRKQIQVTSSMNTRKFRHYSLGWE